MPIRSKVSCCGIHIHLIECIRGFFESLLCLFVSLGVLVVVCYCHILLSWLSLSCARHEWRNKYDEGTLVQHHFSVLKCDLCECLMSTSIKGNVSSGTCFFINRCCTIPVRLPPSQCFSCPNEGRMLISITMKVMLRTIYLLLSSVDRPLGV